LLFTDMENNTQNKKRGKKSGEGEGKHRKGGRGRKGTANQIKFEAGGEGGSPH